MSWTDQATNALKIAALKADLALLETSITAAATDDIQTYRLSSGRQVGRIPVAEKIQLHDFLNAKLIELENEESISNDEGNTNLYLPRFNR
jgi:hypothetical protein